MLSAFRRDPAGTVALKFALLMLVVLGLGGGAADMAFRNARTAELQGAADAAALAAIAPSDLAEKARVTTGEATFLANLERAAAPPEVGIEGRIATVAAVDATPGAFLGLFGLDRLPIRVSARAVRDADPLCLLLLEGAGTGLHLNAHARLQADCSVTVNSTGAHAAYANSHSVARSRSLCVAGGVKTNAGGRFEPRPELRCPRDPDPLAALPEPPEARASCDHHGVRAKTGEQLTLRPGVYCGGLDVNSGSSVTLQPGLYVVRDGELRVNARSTLSGERVMIFLQGDRGRLDVNAGSTMTLTPPTSGAYKGVTIFQSRDPASAGSGQHRINAHGEGRIEGVVYLPNGELRINAHSGAESGPARALFILRKLELNAGASMNLRLHPDSPLLWPAGLERPPESSSARLLQ